MTTDRTPKERTARSGRTVEKIEIAALQAISAFGRDRFTTHDVATLSGLSIGTVYRYFPDRVAILNRVAPIPPNAIDAVTQIEIALASLDRYPIYEPKGLRQALMTARELLSTAGASRENPDHNTTRRRRRPPARVGASFLAEEDAGTGLDPERKTH